MKIKAPLFVLSALLLASCGVSTPTSSASSSSPAASSDVTFSSKEASSAEDTTQEKSSKEESSESKEEQSSKPVEASSEAKTSEKSEESSAEEISSSPKEDSSSYVAPGSSDEEASSIDLDGFVEYAEAPSGAVLTDWTDEMKAILSKHLAGYIPPFLWMEDLRVTFDNLDILQARGTSYEGVWGEYLNLLLQSGFDAYATEANSGISVMGRIFLENCAIYIDALDANGIFSINFEMDLYLSSWPTEGIQSIVSTEYESSTVVPPLPADRYIVESDVMYNIFILCLGDSITEDSIGDYIQILTENKWKVAALEGENEGYYSAQSRDALVVLLFYWDGRGVQIEITHGEGETYDSWDSVVPALEDFAVTELGLSGLTTPVPSFDDGDRYEIDRSARGWLKVQITRDSANVTATMMEAYIKKCQDAGFRIDRSRPDEFGVLAFSPEEDYVLSIFITEDVDEYGGDADRLEICLISPISLTHYIYYAWPEDRVNFFLSSISASKAVIVSVDVDNATYYASRDIFNGSLEILIKGVPSDVVSLYKAELEKYDYATSLADGVLKATDMKKLIDLEASVSGQTMKIVLTKHVEALSSNEISFEDDDLISERDPAWTYVVWGGSPYSFRVDKGSSSVTVGNYGDFIEDPLRVYKGQKITISPEEGKIIQSVAFYGENVTIQGSDRYGFSLNNLTRLSSAKASYDSSSSVSETNKYVYSVDAEAGEDIVFQMPSDGSFGLASVVVTFAD